MTITLERPIAADTDFRAIVDELTRRGFLGGALGSAALLGLAACGSDSDSPSGSASASATTRAIRTAKGVVDVPVTPKRVVAIQPSAVATLYDVGLDPIGVYNQGSQYISPRYRAKWTKAPDVGSAGEIVVEKVAALEPDLIVGVDYEWNTKPYAQLSKLAPTVIAPATSWQATADTTAEAVGRSAQLDVLKKKVTARSAQIKSTYAGALAKYKWDILQGGFDKGKFWLYGPGSDAGTILAGAGVQFASASAKVPGANNSPTSYENIDILDDAGMIGYYANFDGTPNNEGPALFKQTQFTRLAAARGKRLVPIPDFLPGGYGDALAVLDELEAGLKKL